MQISISFCYGLYTFHMDLSQSNVAIARLGYELGCWSIDFFFQISV